LVAETVVPEPLDALAAVAELSLEPPDDGVVVEVVAEPLAAEDDSSDANATAAGAVALAAATTVSASAEANETTELMLRQAPQPAQGPSGQSPVDGSPEVVVATARVVVVVADFCVVVVVDGGAVAVVVVDATGSDWERSQMLSPLVSTYRLHAPG
jgi:hypothetical protein